jgi:D-glycero-D-manno-heptose 1,7-bisphosphate phosphatase
VAEPANPSQNLPRTADLRTIFRTAFLDRDGVLNLKPPEGQYVTRWSEFHLLPGVPEAIGRLNRAGLKVIVVSNQRGIALGLYTAADVETIHAALQRALAAHSAHIDAFYFCPHDRAVNETRAGDEGGSENQSACDCRKPLPGLYHQARADFPDITPESSLMIGDSWSDIEFGRRLGVSTIFIDGDPTRQKPGADRARSLADHAFASLPEAVDALLDPATNKAGATDSTDQHGSKRDTA